MVDMTTKIKAKAEWTRNTSWLVSELLAAGCDISVGSP